MKNYYNSIMIDKLIKLVNLHDYPEMKINIVRLYVILSHLFWYSVFYDAHFTENIL